MSKSGKIYQSFEPISYKDVGLRQIIKHKYFEEVILQYAFCNNFDVAGEVSNMFEEKDIYLPIYLESYIIKCREKNLGSLTDSSIYGLKLNFKILDMRKSLVQISGDKIVY